jgi:hypothetical protein
MCSIAGNLCFENVYRSYVDLNTMERCFVTLFCKTSHHSVLMYILCTILINLYDSKVLRIQCVSVFAFKISCTLYFFATFYMQFSGVCASFRLSCEYVNCIIFQIFMPWLFKLWSSFGFFYNM